MVVQRHYCTSRVPSCFSLRPLFIRLYNYISAIQKEIIVVLLLAEIHDLFINDVTVCRIIH